MTTQILQQNIDFFGLKHQLGILMEECAELIQASHKIIRNDINKKLTTQLAEEIADVEIVIEQIKLSAALTHLRKDVEEFKVQKI